MELSARQRALLQRIKDVGYCYVSTDEERELDWLEDFGLAETVDADGIGWRATITDAGREHLRQTAARTDAGSKQP